LIALQKNAAPKGLAILAAVRAQSRRDASFFGGTFALDCQGRARLNENVAARAEAAATAAIAAAAAEAGGAAFAAVKAAAAEAAAAAAGAEAAGAGALGAFAAAAEAAGGAGVEGEDAAEAAADAAAADAGSLRAASAAGRRVRIEDDSVERDIGGRGHEQAAAQAGPAAAAKSAAAAGAAPGNRVLNRQVLDRDIAGIDEQAAVGALAVERRAVAIDGQRVAALQIDGEGGSGFIQRRVVGQRDDVVRAVAGRGEIDGLDVGAEVGRGLNVRIGRRHARHSSPIQCHPRLRFTAPACSSSTMSGANSCA
jgi:hypothetical protein